MIQARPFQTSDNYPDQTPSNSYFTKINAFDSVYIGLHPIDKIGNILQVLMPKNM